MIGVVCASPSCRYVEAVTGDELVRGLIAVLTPKGWSYERQLLDTESNWYCPRCKEADDAAA